MAVPRVEWSRYTSIALALALALAYAYVQCRTIHRVLSSLLYTYSYISIYMCVCVCVCGGDVLLVHVCICDGICTWQSYYFIGRVEYELYIHVCTYIIPKVVDTR